jgi:cell wall-associated NlpC family hydrolase
MAERRDPRLTPARPDLAAESLRGVVKAERYAAPLAMEAATPAVPLTATPDPDAPMTTELLLGERFDVYERKPGWVWGQSARDGYVGYAPDSAMAPAGGAATHRVTALLAHVYPQPSIKSRPVGAAPLGAALRGEAGPEGFVALAAGGFACAAHVAPADAPPPPDWVAIAERFLGVPYLWGGRTAGGLDCSGLVQIARLAAGFDCQRDSDMQEGAPGDNPERLDRGDLVFWRGHVGIMVSPETLLHANAHHMMVETEPLADAESRIAATGGGPITARRRWAGAALRQGGMAR